MALRWQMCRNFGSARKCQYPYVNTHMGWHLGSRRKRLRARHGVDDVCPTMPTGPVRRRSCATKQVVSRVHTAWSAPAHAKALAVWEPCTVVLVGGTRFTLLALVFILWAFCKGRFKASTWWLASGGWPSTHGPWGGLRTSIHITTCSYNPKSTSDKVQSDDACRTKTWGAYGHGDCVSE